VSHSLGFLLAKIFINFSFFYSITHSGRALHTPAAEQDLDAGSSGERQTAEPHTEQTRTADNHTAEPRTRTAEPRTRTAEPRTAEEVTAEPRSVSLFGQAVQYLFNGALFIIILPFLHYLLMGFFRH
jgi:hypothetical protein